MECLQHRFLTNGNLIRFNEELQQEHVQFSETSIEDTNIPFLQMLQCVEPSSAFLPFKEPNNILESILQIQTLEPERCLSHETTATDNIDQPLIFSSFSSSPPAPASRADPETDPKAAGNGTLRERRKRKRTRTPKNKEEEESQRLNHIAVERNRRRQMNEHLISLRSLMPPSYLQRGDQASIVGGAIDFIKELEQLLHSLEAAAAGGKRIKAAGDGDDNAPEKVTVSSSTSSSSRACNSSLLSVSTSDDGLTARSAAGGGESTEEIEATVIQNHVNLKVRCKRRGGQRQIVKAIVFLEKLNLTTLHLNITSSSSSSPDSVFYSFNLKMEDDCKVGSAEGIVVAVHEMFKQINGG